ncbi:hypothetical protein [Novosphingopyxis sp.]|uniref:hypothetical protein n=1 Tax=Novosphingopyxis sp. TaxID=2709690 RepID=UPI003B59104D
MEFLLAFVQRPFALLEPDHSGTGVILSPTGLERRAHAAHEIVGVQRARQHQRVAERIDPGFVGIAAGLLPGVRQNHERQAGPGGLLFDEFADRTQFGVVAYRLFGDENHPDTVLQQTVKFHQVGCRHRIDFLTGQQFARDIAVAAARGQDRHAHFLRTDFSRHRDRRRSARLRSLCKRDCRSGYR